MSSRNTSILGQTRYYGRFVRAVLACVVKEPTAHLVAQQLVPSVFRELVMPCVVRITGLLEIRDETVEVPADQLVDYCQPTFTDSAFFQQYLGGRYEQVRREAFDETKDFESIKPTDFHRLVEIVTFSLGSKDTRKHEELIRDLSHLINSVDGYASLQHLP